MYDVVTTGLADQDIIDSCTHISRVLCNPAAAERLLDEVEAAIISLEDMPQRQKLVSDEYLSSLGFRILPVRNYLLFYIVREENKTVVVERFLYNRRDWQSILGDYYDA